MVAVNVTAGFLSKKLAEINEFILAHRTSKFSQCTVPTVTGYS